MPTCSANAPISFVATRMLLRLSVRLQSAAHRLHVQAELARRFRLVVADALERLENERPLRFGKRSADGEPDSRVAGTARTEERRQVARLDPAAPRHDHRALDHIAQLAHI